MRENNDQPAVPAPREDIDHLILPTLHHRVRESLTFLAVAQSVYGVVLVFSQGPGLEARASLNIVRLVALYTCVYFLRGEPSRRKTLALAGLGIAAQLFTGVAISVVRQDVFPMVLLLCCLASIGSVHIPWGGAVQGAVSLAAAIGIQMASALVGQPMNLDAFMTFATILGVTTYIAHSRGLARRHLEQRFDEARRDEEELATLRVQLERRVAERTAELQMANRELEGFSYTVSHDLRSPLRTIAGFSQLILDESGAQLDETARENLAKICAAGRRMDGLIDDMLLLARVGRSALRYETVDLAAIARSVGDQVAAENPGRNVVLTIDPVPLVHGDHALLRIALDNLLRNAWKFTDTGARGEISVYGQEVAGEIVCCVRDNGIGFDPRFQSKLFQPFQRIHGDERFAGTGVGLATVARIVHRHGGEVQAEGNLDQGATFSIRLPLTRAETGQG